ncbi:MAG TPA: hypothetical protein VIV58_31840 [Kofleriaceae bacterium]
MTRPVSDGRLKELSAIAPNLGLNRESAEELRALASELLIVRGELSKLRAAAPVMLTVMAMLADEADLAGLRECAEWHRKIDPEYLETWLDAERARSLAAGEGQAAP